MPVLTITKTYVNGNILSASDLDSAYDSISTFLNTTKIDSTNVQTGGLTGANLANSTVNTSQLAAGAVTSSIIASSAVGSGQIGPLAVQTGHLALGAVTNPTRAALGQVSSTGLNSVGYSTSANAFSDITNMTLPSLTTSGRPVLIIIYPNDPTLNGGGFFNINRSGVTAAGQLGIARNGTLISSSRITISGGNTSGLSVPGNFTFLDTPSSGTYIYKAQLTSDTQGTAVTIASVGMTAFEL